MEHELSYGACSIDLLFEHYEIHLLVFKAFGGVLKLVGAESR